MKEKRVSVSHGTSNPTLKIEYIRPLAIQKNTQITFSIFKLDSKNPSCFPSRMFIRFTSDRLVWRKNTSITTWRCVDIQVELHIISQTIQSILFLLKNGLFLVPLGTQLKLRVQESQTGSPRNDFSMAVIQG